MHGNLGTDAVSGKHRRVQANDPNHVQGGGADWRMPALLLLHAGSLATPELTDLRVGAG